MGYDYYLKGKITINKKLPSGDFNDFLASINKKNHPGKWCPYKINKKSEIVPQGVARRTEHIEWLKFIIENFIVPLKAKVNGIIKYAGNLSFDEGQIIVKNNKITVDYNKKLKFGLLCETEKEAKNLGFDKVTGYSFTGLDTYLKSLYPDVKDWKYKKTVNLEYENKKISITPTYTSDKLHLMVVYFGKGWFENKKSYSKYVYECEKYEELLEGYRFVEIPFYQPMNKKFVEEKFSDRKNKNVYFKNNTTCFSSYNKTSSRFLCEEVMTDFEITVFEQKEIDEKDFYYTQDYLAFVDHYVCGGYV